MENHMKITGRDMQEQRERRIIEAAMVLAAEEMGIRLDRNLDELMTRFAIKVLDAFKGDLQLQMAMLEKSFDMKLELERLKPPAPLVVPNAPQP